MIFFSLPNQLTPIYQKILSTCGPHKLKQQTRLRYLFLTHKQQDNFTKVPIDPIHILGLLIRPCTECMFNQTFHVLLVIVVVVVRKASSISQMLVCTYTKTHSTINNLVERKVFTIDLVFFFFVFSHFSNIYLACIFGEMIQFTDKNFCFKYTLQFVQFLEICWCTYTHSIHRKNADNSVCVRIIYCLLFSCTVLEYILVKILFFFCVVCTYMYRQNLTIIATWVSFFLL